MNAAQVLDELRKKRDAYLAQKSVDTQTDQSPQAGDCVSGSSLQGSRDGLFDKFGRQIAEIVEFPHDNDLPITTYNLESGNIANRSVDDTVYMILSENVGLTAGGIRSLLANYHSLQSPIRAGKYLVMRRQL